MGNALGKEGSGVKTTSGMWCTMATCPLFGMPMVAGIVRVSCPKGSGFAVYYVYLAPHCIDPGHQEKVMQY